MRNNGYLDVEDQIDLIKSKGIIIDKDAELILNRINYYTIMNYRNWFYKNNRVHNYKDNIYFNDFVKLHKYDSELKIEFNNMLNYVKNDIINKISKFFGYFEHGFCEEGYFSEELYDEEIIHNYYNNIIKNNLMVKEYFNNHGFAPIWVLLNTMDYREIIKYLLSFNDEAFNSIFTNVEIENAKLIFNYTIKLYSCLISNDKIIDFNYNNIKINELLIWLDTIYQLDIDKIIDIYIRIVNDIDCIDENDVSKNTGIFI